MADSQRLDPDPEPLEPGFVVLDLAGLRYRFAQSSLAVLAPSGELLAVLDLPSSWDRRTAAFHGCEQVLERGFLRRANRRLKVALYNPLSAQVALYATPHTQVFGDLAPLVLPAEGLLAGLDGEVLDVSGRALPRLEVTFAALTRSLLAHEA